MGRSTLRRTGALLFSAALLASLTAATVAGPASAAKPKCQGQTATIVGTAKGEIIRGTAKRDIIVAKGGHDRIYGRGGNDLICAGTGNDVVYGGPGADTVWGQLGNDRLNGNAGPDFLAGQVGNDTINGGLQVDKCYQGTGAGAVLNCELPAPPVVVAPPPVPDPINLTNVLAIAYTDLNRNHTPDAGDVMIAQFVDTDGNGPDAGDQIVMGRYPTALNPTWPTDFAAWGVKSHTADGSGLSFFPDEVQANSTSGGGHAWFRTNPPNWTDLYNEASGVNLSEIKDYFNDNPDSIQIDPASPSRPSTAIVLAGNGTPDDYFVDVEIFYP